MGHHDTVHDSLTPARALYDRRDWGGAYDQLRVVSEADGLVTDDLERLAVAAYLTGRGDAAEDALERLHHVLLDDGEVAEAARWAIWLAILLFQGGYHARGGGWLARAERLLAETSLDCPARGYLLVAAALQALGGGDGAKAFETFEQVAAIAQRFGDADLTVLGVLGRGQALVAMGDAEHGVAMLDEAMVAATTDDVLPIVTGIAYCAVILTCRAVFDLRRAQEWTAVLSRWCSQQQDLQPYRGQCLVHRSEIMQLHGEWREAMTEIERACEHLSDPAGDPVLGMARYQQAELLRLRGQLPRAEESYRQASELGHPPHPGLALLRLAQGRVDAAVSVIQREMNDIGGDRVRRARVLAAYVEILLAAGDLDRARPGVNELEATAADFDSVYLQAASAQARGSVQLAEGNASEACVTLRQAWQAWHDLDAPYEAAWARLLMAAACRRLGDHDAADLELDTARRVFEHLGAAPALVRVAELSHDPTRAVPGGLTPREVEVLRLVATGATNREVADTLVISEKTVARHLSNMFTKLRITSRAAATAWAYEHDLA